LRLGDVIAMICVRGRETPMKRPFMRLLAAAVLLRAATSESGARLPSR
jgi:hypothetical protein